jgi:DUF4097 and DUF4098 domain-containing protein YvlB
MMRIFLCAVVAAAAAFAQTDPQPRMKCEGNHSDGNRSRFCEIREQTIGFPGQLNVDGRENGGISVFGWSRQDVLVRSKVEAHAESDSQAKAMAGLVRVNTSAGKVAADGPTMENNRSWSVSYEIFVPHSANLDLDTHNGGVHVSGVNGNITFSAVNGGIHLAQVGGSVKGKTVNGGIHVELAGTAWQGQGLDAETTNGGIHVTVPANYSAHLEASTVNGGMHVDFPGAPSHSKTNQVSMDLGSGGPPVRLVTTNGGVHVGTI